MSDIDRDRRLVQARERANTARLRFVNTAYSTRRRLAPARLKEDALVAIGDKVDEAKQDLQQTVRRHPFLTASGVVGLLAVMFWKPARIAAIYGWRGSQLLRLNNKFWSSIE